MTAINEPIKGFSFVLFCFVCSTLKILKVLQMSLLNRSNFLRLCLFKGFYTDSNICFEQISSCLFKYLPFWKWATHLCSGCAWKCLGFGFHTASLASAVCCLLFPCTKEGPQNLLMGDNFSFHKSFLLNTHYASLQCVFILCVLTAYLLSALLLETNTVIFSKYFNHYLLLHYLISIPGNLR